jgi:hypothetical protein
MTRNLNFTRRVVIGLLGTPLLSAIAGGLPAIATAQTVGSSNWASDGTRDALVAALPRYFGRAKASYVNLKMTKKADLADGDRTSLLSQFTEVFSQVPDPEFTTSSGFRVLPAYVQHDAAVEAFVVTLGESNTIVAAAMLHNNCGKYNSLSDDARAPGGPCDAIPTLSIIYHSGATPNAEVNAALTSFVSKQMSARLFHGMQSKLRVNIRKLRA